MTSEVGLEPVRRYRRGYRSDASLRQAVRAYEGTYLGRNILSGLGCHAIMLAVVLVMITTWYMGWRMLVAVEYLPALLLIARQQRVLELMVHDASHGSWSRRWPQLNNAAANFLAAWPMLSDLNTYWKSHKLHHQVYGSSRDPCRRRFDRMGLGRRDLSTTPRIAAAVVAWLPRYFLDYYREVGASPKRLAVMLAWHGIVYVGPASLIFGWGAAVVCWTLCWVVPMLTTLPVLRSIAEAEEHDYTLGDTEFETTFTNRGVLHRWLIHPWNDEFHQIHHQFPSIAQREHRKVHVLLMSLDEAYRRSLHRTGILRQ